MVSEYWDMDSSQASNQLENIGRFAAENNDMMMGDYQDASSLDHQAMVINNPLNNRLA